MKSVIPLAIQETYEKHFGTDGWKQVLGDAGLPPNHRFFGHQDTDDGTVVAMIESVMERKDMTMDQLSDAFGDYWVNDFAARHYFAFYVKSESAKEFLQNMNAVHEKIGSKVEGSKPPRFSFDWEDDNTMIMGYHSERGLIDLVTGLVKGAGIKFNEDLKVTKIDDTRVRVVFPN